jgi:hypothetical protein
VAVAPTVQNFYYGFLTNWASAPLRSRKASANAKNLAVYAIVGFLSLNISLEGNDKIDK